MLLGPEIPLAAGMLRHVAAGHLWCHCSEGRVAELRWVLMLAAAPGGTKNGQVSKTDTSEPFKRTWSKHVPCNQIFKLFTSLKNCRPFHCICCINLGVGEAELMENEGLYLLLGKKKKKVKLLFIKKDELVKAS